MDWAFGGGVRSPDTGSGSIEFNITSNAQTMYFINMYTY